MKHPVGHLYCILAASMLAFASASCGGGGGGGSGGDKSSNDASRGLRILHGAIETGPVSVVEKVSDGEKLAGSLQFGSSRIAPLESGDRNVEVRFSGPEPVAPVPLTLSISEERQPSFLIAGFPEEPVRQTLLIQPPSDADLSEATPVVRVIHGLSRASQVNVIISGGRNLSVGYGKASAFVPFTSGTPTLISLTRGIDGRSLGSVTVSGNAGQAFSVFIGGEAEYYSFINVIEE